MKGHVKIGLNRESVREAMQLWLNKTMPLVQLKDIVAHKNGSMTLVVAEKETKALPVTEPHKLHYPQGVRDLRGTANENATQNAVESAPEELTGTP